MQENRKLEEPEVRKIVKQDLYCYSTPGPRPLPKALSGYTERTGNTFCAGRTASNTAPNIYSEFSGDPPRTSSREQFEGGVGCQR
jgi:hypothetical protein